MSKIDKSLYYLDSSIFITYLLKKDNDSNYLKEVIDIFDNPGKRKIVTSVVTLAEVLPENNPKNKLEKKYETDYDKFIETIKPKCEIVDEKLAFFAGELRSHFLKEENNGSLKHFDSIHVASAIKFGAEYLWTKDNGMIKLDTDSIKDLIPNDCILDGWKGIKIIKPEKPE